MELVEMVRSASFVTSTLVCAALAIYFLHAFLRKRLRASSWWATGFSLLTCGISAMTVIALYGSNRIQVVLAFVLTFVAASVAFFYYAASLHFFHKTSFFRKQFTVILFGVFLVLFLLPLYLFPEERTVALVGSSEIALFVVAFLAIAVLFTYIVRNVLKKFHCRRIVALQSLAWWIVALWSLCIVLFWESAIAIGLVFVLSLLGFLLLLYGCKGGDIVGKEDMDEEKELYIQEIYGVRDKIKREADYARKKLNDGMQKIGDALVYTVTERDFAGLWADIPKEKIEKLTKELETLRDSTKDKMVSRASAIGREEDKLVVHLVELAENVLEFAISGYVADDPQPTYDRVPLYVICAEMSIHSSNTSQEVQESAGSGKIERLATLAFFKNSTDKDLKEICCELVISVCDVENLAVTEYKWEGLRENQHPGGFIGHTYNILRHYDMQIAETKKDEAKKDEAEKEEYPHSEDFRDEYQEKADELWEKARDLRTRADELLKEVKYPKTEADNSENPQQTSAATNSGQKDENITSYLSEAIDLLQHASKLIFCASETVEDYRKGLTY
ncbi:MAG: hypothetical protein HXS46_08610 [Theionarchaea archaeon]|nr:MAG: hypothetical protein AYK18_05485 [Theionarchaea archaeon DG-70]MBU7010738.1 hypothetical protein [Theionarchaea archaeon]